MQLPKNLNELVFILQKGITQAQFNSMYAQQIAAQKNSISQTQAQILAQLQNLNAPNQIQAFVQNQMAAQLPLPIKNLPLTESGMISLTQISEMIQVNGKEALTKLIVSMTEASKQGIKDLSNYKSRECLLLPAFFAYMEFRTLVNIKLFAKKMTYDSKVVSLGSCFSTEMGNRLLDRKYDVLLNPLGIAFNPMSIAMQIEKSLDLDL